MSKILQKRIEEAAKNICCTDCPFENIRVCKTCVESQNAVNVATFALQNQWISVDEALPEDDIQVLTRDEDGHIVVAYHDKDGWWWCDGFVDGVDIKGQPIYSSSYSMKVPAYWMYKPSLKGGEK